MTRVALSVKGVPMDVITALNAIDGMIVTKWGVGASPDFSSNAM
ncbi:MAG: hypothetical protein ACJAUN_001616 [Alcanivorax sp.]|jgi:hypothetical protein